MFFLPFALLCYQCRRVCVAMGLCLGTSAHIRNESPLLPVPRDSSDHCRHGGISERAGSIQGEQGARLLDYNFLLLEQ